MTPPAVTVIGDVVDLRTALSWFETKPLFGWRVLVPRTKEQAGSLSARLRSFGSVPEEVPTISVEPPRNPQQMDKAIRGLVEGRYEWVAFTSVNAVKAVREKFDEYGLDARAFSGLKIAAVGDKTAEAIGAWGIRPDLVPSGEQSAAGPDAGRDQDREVRRGRLHLVVDRTEPGRDRRQAPPVDRHRSDRAGDGEDLRGARPAGRRRRAEAFGRRAGRRARGLRRQPATGDDRGRRLGHQAVGAAAR
jgi:hypothetical protein